MSWIPGLWMGLFWIGLGIFILVSSMLGKASFILPVLKINLGWVVMILGVLRIWWWWKTEEEPKRRRQELDADLAKMDAELAKAYPITDADDETDDRAENVEETESSKDEASAKATDEGKESDGEPDEDRSPKEGKE